MDFPPKSYLRSWAAPAPGFEAVLKHLLGEFPHFRETLPPIWQTRSKTVWRVTLPEKFGGYDVAFKYYRCPRPYRYIFRNSPQAREADNFRFLGSIGVPVADLVGVGDFRSGLRLDGGFLVTRFFENSLDGRAFMPGGAWRENTGYRDIFCREVRRVLHIMHRCRYFHHGTHPYNFLWRETGNADQIEICCIDFASGRIVPPFQIGRCARRDLAMFEADMALNDGGN